MLQSNQTHLDMAPAAYLLQLPVARLRRDVGVYVNSKLKSCIRLHESDDHVLYVILDMARGLVIERLRATTFYVGFRPITTIGGPTDTIKKFAALARYIGSDHDTLTVLSRITPIPQEDMTMAIARKVAREAKKTEQAAAAKGAAKKDGAKSTSAKKSGSTTPVSAASQFQALIMKGTMTDEQIFKAVQTQFGLSDSKRGYVQWYRNYLKKNGKNPPAAKS